MSNINTPCSLPKELKLILNILNGSKPSQTLNQEMDWDLFLQLIVHHRLYPVLFPLIKHNNNLPEQIKVMVRKYYQHNTLQMLHLCLEMNILSQICGNQDIKLLILKGPLLAEDLYGDLSLRTCGDIDVMVPINDLHRMEKVLKSEGYVKDDYIKTVLGDWKWRHHHVSYFHQTKGIKVEVHWRLNPGPSSEPSFEQLWDRKRVYNSGMHTTYFLGKEDLFFFLVTHGGRHGWSRLRWLMDIHQLLKQEMDWEAIRLLLSRYHYNHVGGQAIQLSSMLFNSPIPYEFKTEVQKNKSRKLVNQTTFYLEKMVNLHSEQVPKEVTRHHQRYLFNLMSLKYRLLFVLSFLHPYPEDAELIPLPKKLHFLYFPLRPIIWAWKKLSKPAIT
ncbi:nucleotidyltransferase domain-containing protein [Rossellomorea arthrocnemi]